MFVLVIFYLISDFIFIFNLRWFPEVQNIFYQGNKKKLIPGSQQTRKITSFFNAASVLMSNQLQNLALLSVNDYKLLLCYDKKKIESFNHPGFIIRLILDGLEIKFEPDFNDFEVILLNVLDVIVKAVMIVPCVETKLYSEWSNQKKFLNPNISDEIVDKLKENIAEVIQKESNGPINHAKLFSKYDYLITREADHEIDEFLLQDHDFDRCIEEVKKYSEMIEEISYDSQKVKREIFILF